MKRFCLYVHLVLFSVLFISAICPKAQAQNQNYNKAIDKYVQFLKNRNQSPVDYVMNLFGHMILLSCVNGLMRR